ATAVRWGIVSILANVVAALALMGPLGHAGLAGAASVGAYVNLMALLVIGRQRLGRLGGRALLSSALRTLLASLPLAALCWLAAALWPARSSFVIDVAWLIATIAAGAGVFWAASAALRITERIALLSLYRRRGRRRLRRVAGAPANARAAPGQRRAAHLRAPGPLQASRSRGRAAPRSHRESRGAAPDALASAHALPRGRRRAHRVARSQRATRRARSLGARAALRDRHARVRVSGPHPR